LNRSVCTRCPCRVQRWIACFQQDIKPRPRQVFDTNLSRTYGTFELIRLLRKKYDRSPIGLRLHIQNSATESNRGSSGTEVTSPPAGCRGILSAGVVERNPQQAETQAVAVKTKIVIIHKYR